VRQHLVRAGKGGAKRLSREATRNQHHEETTETKGDALSDGAAL
jgi:hypothetical protein